MDLSSSWKKANLNWVALVWMGYIIHHNKVRISRALSLIERACSIRVQQHGAELKLSRHLPICIMSDQFPNFSLAFPKLEVEFWNQRVGNYQQKNQIKVCKHAKSRIWRYHIVKSSFSTQNCQVSALFPAFIAVRKIVPFFLQSILCLADGREGRLAKKRMFIKWPPASAEILDKMAAALAHFVHNGVQII